MLYVVLHLYDSDSSLIDFSAFFTCSELKNKKPVVKDKLQKECTFLKVYSTGLFQAANKITGINSTKYLQPCMLCYFPLFRMKPLDVRPHYITRKLSGY
jgi:hypothetical protein